MRIIWLLAVALAFGCTKETKPSKMRRGRGANDVVIGAVLPLTGPRAAYGVAAKSGIDLAVQQQNDSGGVFGRAVRVAYLDDRSKSDVAAEAAQRLILEEKAVLLIGAASTEPSLAMAAVAVRGRTPMITPSATSPDVTAHGPWVFRTCFEDPFQAIAMASHAKDRLQLSKIAVLRDVGSDYSIRLADAFERSFVREGGAIVAHGTYDANDEKLELKPLIEAEAIYVPGYDTDIRRIVAEAKKLGFEGRFLGADGWDTREVRRLGAEVEGAQFTTHFAPDDPRAAVADFVKTYERVMNETPDAMAALGYDTARFALLALQNAGRADRERVREALATGKLDGVTGAIEVDADGNARKPAIVVRLENGRTKYVSTFPPLGDAAKLQAP